MANRIIIPPQTRFGRLTVVKLSETHKTKEGTRKWECICDCGNTFYADGWGLRNGLAVSCGCKLREWMKSSDKPHTKAMALRLEGQRFGKLIALSPASVVLNSGKKAYRWNCACDCGGERLVLGANLKSGKITNCGCLTGWKRRLTAAANGRKGMLPFGESARRSVITHYKISARNRKLEWGLTDAQFLAITQQYCFYCGDPPSTVFESKSKNGSYTYNGIDRLDSTQGYTLGNIAACCKTCNYAKGAVHVDYFIDWIRRVYERFDEAGFFNPNLLRSRSTSGGSLALLPLD